MPSTLVAYYPGCFAEFHDGHMAVVRETVEAMKAVTDDYRVIIAPANSDYTMSKYGDVVQASNKYRYDKIMNWLRGAEGMERVHIDLNPMLNFDRDHNFPDLIDDFLKGHGLELNIMERAPFVVCGKDRDWSNLRRATNRIRVFYSQGDSTSSSAIMAAKAPMPRVKKDLILRCTTWYDLNLFAEHFGDQYKSVKALYKSDEMGMARELCEKHKFDFTICKEYHSLLPYHQVSRKWHNPLDQSGRGKKVTMKLFQVTEGNMQQSDWAIKKIPVIIRMMQDDEAVVTMVDSNLQREQITPSEKAYAYKMKYDAIKKKAGRKNCGQVDHNTGKRSIDVIGELCGDSAKQVH
jgi:hypothetical protein